MGGGQRGAVVSYEPTGQEPDSERWGAGGGGVQVGIRGTVAGAGVT